MFQLLQDDSQQVSVHATFVPESPEMLDASRDMFADSIAESPTVVPETPILPPSPPPMPASRLNFVQTMPITPVRLQGQRWRNWAFTRLSHLPANEVYTDEEVRSNLEDQPVEDNIEENVEENAEENVEENVEKNVEENVEENDKEPTKKTITAKPVKERKRKLAFEVPQEEKARCEKGKWTYNYQGGETFCVDGYSYTINNHTISKKTGGLSLYLICTKCGGRNILTNGKLKKDDHPGHTCSPDPDNWTILEADLRLKSLGE